MWFLSRFLPGHAGQQSGPTQDKRINALQADRDAKGCGSAAVASGSSGSCLADPESSNDSTTYGVEPFGRVSESGHHQHIAGGEADCCSSAAGSPLKAKVPLPRHRPTSFDNEGVKSDSSGGDMTGTSRTVWAVVDSSAGPASVAAEAHSPGGSAAGGVVSAETLRHTTAAAAGTAVGATLPRKRSRVAMRGGHHPARKFKRTQTQLCWARGPPDARASKTQFLRRVARQGGVHTLWSDWYAHVACRGCGRRDQEDQMLMCDECDCGFHMHCLRPILVSYPQGAWACPGCHRQRDACAERAFAEETSRFKSNQASVLQYFRNVPLVPAHVPASGTTAAVGGGGGGGGGGGTIGGGAAARTLPKISNAHAAKHRQCFRVAVPVKDDAQRLHQLATFASAMKVNGMEYQEELTYRSRRAQRLNSAKRDVTGVRELSAYNKAAVLKMKQMWRQGQCPPIVIRRCPHEGLAVYADGPLPDRTLLCEYVGEVGLLKNHMADPHDSLMDLVDSGDPISSLVISPEHRGNIARFLSGVNNTSTASLRQINVRSARFSVDGIVRVFLYCCRNIPRGAKLCYDYNGFRSGYPTEHFT